MQAGTTPNREFGRCWVPSIVAFHDQQGLLRTYSSPGSSIRSPHLGSPRGDIEERGVAQGGDDMGNGGGGAPGPGVSYACCHAWYSLTSTVLTYYLLLEAGPHAGAG